MEGRPHTMAADGSLDAERVNQEFTPILQHALQRVRVLLGDAGAELAGHGQRGVRTMRHFVEHAQPHSELDRIPASTDA